MLKNSGQATISDVARTASVSVGTVSRVLAGNETVGPELRKRVQDAIDSLNYRPNPMARAMRTKRVNILGLLVPDISNPFFGQIAKEVEIEAEARGFSVLLANSHGDRDREGRQIQSLVERSLSGLIVVACSDNVPAIDTSDIPIISLDRRLAGTPLASIDNEADSHKLGRLIAELGHRNVAYLSGPLSMQIVRQRARGFKAGFLDGDAKDRVLREFEGTFSYQTGEELARSLLLSADRPTAIIGANDQIAIGALRAARDLKIAVPECLSIAGFDDIVLASLVAPSLTTISQPARQLAALAVQKLVSEWPIIEDEMLPGRLIERQSTGKCPSE